MTEARTYHGNTPPYDLLSKEDLEKIVDATFHLLREIGIKFDPDPRAMDLFAKAGCDVSDGIVKFPAELIERAIDTVGKSVKLWNRPGSGHVELSDGHMLFFAGVTGPNVVDLETGNKRSGTAEDIATISRVADALPDIDGVCLPCKIIEESTVEGQIKEFVTMVANTSKPLNYLCEDTLPLQAAIEIASAVRGGPATLREKPYFLFFVTPLPLYFAAAHINHIFLCVENGIPLTSLTVTIGGASAPVTVAGNVVHSLATDLACIVLTQLIEEGSFCGCGSVLAFIDPRTGGMGALPEMDLAELVKSQTLRHLGLPPAGSFAGGSVDVRFGQYAAAVAESSMLRTFYARPGHSWHLGLIDSGMTFSLHSLLYCHELVAWLRRMWKGVPVDDDALALDVTRTVGPGGDYMAEMHTAKHCRTDLWDSRYFTASLLTGSGEADEGSADLVDVIDAHLREILETHHPDPLPDSIKKQIDSILKRHGIT